MKVNLIFFIFVIAFTPSFLIAKDKSSLHLSQVRESLSEVDKERFLRALEINEKLHAAFFEYQADQVEKYANELVMSLKSISDEEILKKLEYSFTKLESIKADNERSKNNENYHVVSMTLIHLLNKYKPSTDYESFTCPMVKKKWIQNIRKSPNVENPYAPEMKSCGSRDH